MNVRRLGRTFSKENRFLALRSAGLLSRCASGSLPTSRLERSRWGGGRLSQPIILCVADNTHNRDIRAISWSLKHRWRHWLCKRVKSAYACQ
jgi:hypothetical protein